MSKVLTVRKIFVIFALLAISAPATAEWKIDLSRRQQQLRERDMKHIQQPNQKNENFLDMIFHGGEPLQDLVILNTESGFVPAKVQIKMGARYRVHVVNVNSKNKNVSFILDAFSEHHGTYFGQVISFDLDPRKTGVFSFHCPETAAEGRLVVLDAAAGIPARQLSSQEKR